MKKGILLAFCLSIMFVCLNLQAARQPSFYHRWQELPSHKLVEMGVHYAEVAVHPDSALACFTIVGNRYNERLDNAEKRLCAQAYIGKWYVYFFCFFDYSKSYESLAKAEEIAKQFRDIMPRIYLNFGCMYQTLAEQGKDTRLDTLALNYYRKSFEISDADGDNVADMAFANLVTVSHNLNSMGSITGEWERYKEMARRRNNPTREYNSLLYQGLLHMQKRLFAEAENLFRKQLDVMPDKPSVVRYRYVAYTNISKALAGQGKSAAAVQALKNAEQIAMRFDMKDAKLEIYSLLAEAYAGQGLSSLSEQYRNHYFRVKDTLLNYHQMMSVNEMHFVNEMKKMDEQMQAIEHRRQMQVIVIYVIVGVAFIIMVFFIVVWKKNRRLRRSNESLYRKTVDMLQTEEEERTRRREIEQELEDLKQRAQPAAEEIKYKNSNLDETDKRELLLRIMTVMESSEEIYSPGFSAERLAQLVDSKYKYVSQVINEKYHCNFSAYLNEYRIKEACKRISDTRQYGRLTIEAICNGVGFKSRSSFVIAFKRFTGLTPSEYLRIASEENKEKNRLKE